MFHLAQEAAAPTPTHTHTCTCTQKIERGVDREIALHSNRPITPPFPLSVASSLPPSHTVNCDRTHPPPCELSFPTALPLRLTSPSSDRHTSRAAASAVQMSATACLLNTFFSACSLSTGVLAWWCWCCCPPAAPSTACVLLLLEHLCSSTTPLSRPRKTRWPAFSRDTAVMRRSSLRWCTTDSVKADRAASDCMCQLAAGGWTGAVSSLSGSSSRCEGAGDHLLVFL